MKHIVRLLAVLALVSAVVPDAQALPGRLRAYGGLVEGEEWLAGAGYELKIPFVTLVPNAEYVFLDKSYVSLNADAQFGFLPIPLVDIWIGAGAGVAFFTPPVGDSKTYGLVNLFAGWIPPCRRQPPRLLLPPGGCLLPGTDRSPGGLCAAGAPVPV